jgi:hypothetical protein
MPAYNTDLNEKILVFLNRAQTRIGKTSDLIAHSVENGLRPENYFNEMETAYYLFVFVKCLDSNENDWTDKEIERFIDIWTAKARLNEVPYFSHGNFNQRIQFV